MAKLEKKTKKVGDIHNVMKKGQKLSDKMGSKFSVYNGAECGLGCQDNVDAWIGTKLRARVRSRAVASEHNQLTLF